MHCNGANNLELVRKKNSYTCHNIYAVVHKCLNTLNLSN